MKLSALFFLLSGAASLAFAQDASVAETIVSEASDHGIDLNVLPFLPTALAETEKVVEQVTETLARRNPTVGKRAAPTIIDVHTHIVPEWLKDLVPTTGGNPTPVWDLSSYLSFMDTTGIQRSIFAFSAPGANIYRGDKLLTVALARLMNGVSAALATAAPNRLSWYAIVPLPYTQEAIAEADWALKAGAAGIVLFSNYEGRYLGDAAFQPFFDALNKRGGKQIVYVHPATPYIKNGNQWIEANPTTYATGNIEFYFETARTFQDLILTSTLIKYTNIHYVIPHTGGAFPAVLDRFIKSAPTLEAATRTALTTRCWWDSAGPTYYHQIAGLLGQEIPKSQLLFGTDFPYAPGFTQANSLAAIRNTPLLSAAEKQAVFVDNAKRLFEGKIRW